MFCFSVFPVLIQSPVLLLIVQHLFKHNIIDFSVHAHTAVNTYWFWSYLLVVVQMFTTEQTNKTVHFLKAYWNVKFRSWSITHWDKASGKETSNWCKHGKPQLKGWTLMGLYLLNLLIYQTRRNISNIIKNGWNIPFPWTTFSNADFLLKRVNVTKLKPWEC